MNKVEDKVYGTFVSGLLLSVLFAILVFMATWIVSNIIAYLISSPLRFFKILTINNDLLSSFTVYVSVLIAFVSFILMVLSTLKELVSASKKHSLIKSKVNGGAK